MYGTGILKGLGVTFKHFVETYVEDIKYLGKKYLKQENFQQRQQVDSRGIYTVQYPEEKIAVPERFRFIPFLVVEDETSERPGHDWCTSCGICAKVCPPQCIWIVRGEDPVTKRPIPEPQAFFIDIDICMNCGYCAEFCPFDAIKMDHDYELSDYDRTETHIHDKEKLSKPFSYWYNLAPTTAFEEAVGRGGWEHSDLLKQKRKEGATITKPVYGDVPDWMKHKQNVTPGTGAVVDTADAGPTKAELEAARTELILRKRQEALARFRTRG